MITLRVAVPGVEIGTEPNVVRFDPGSAESALALASRHGVEIEIWDRDRRIGTAEVTADGVWSITSTPLPPHARFTPPDRRSTGLPTPSRPQAG